MIFEPNVIINKFRDYEIALDRTLAFVVVSSVPLDDFWFSVTKLL